MSDYIFLIEPEISGRRVGYIRRRHQYIGRSRSGERKELGYILHRHYTTRNSRLCSKKCILLSSGRILNINIQVFVEILEL